jgi:hypothetical protein
VAEMRFRLNYFEGGFCKIEDMFTGTEKSIKATFESIVGAIKETYKNDVYMLDDDAKETYANEMLAKNNILDTVDSFLDESKKIESEER